MTYLSTAKRRTIPLSEKCSDCGKPVWKLMTQPAGMPVYTHIGPLWLRSGYTRYIFRAGDPLIGEHYVSPKFVGSVWRLNDTTKVLTYRRE